MWLFSFMKNSKFVIKLTSNPWPLCQHTPSTMAWINYWQCSSVPLEAVDCRRHPVNQVVGLPNWGVRHGGHCDLLRRSSTLVACPGSQAVTTIHSDQAWVTQDSSSCKTQLVGAWCCYYWGPVTWEMLGQHTELQEILLVCCQIPPTLWVYQGKQAWMGAPWFGSWRGQVRAIPVAGRYASPLSQENSCLLQASLGKLGMAW